MKLHNGTSRPIYATVEGTTYGVESGKSISVSDPVVATTLCEYGLSMDPDAYAEALDAASVRQRAENSATASASASEGAILARQATVDVESGLTTGTPVTTPAADPTHADDPVVVELKGEELDAAVKAANEAGAEIGSSLKADEKRAALAAFELAQSTPAPEFEETEDGDVVLDGEGNPVPYGSPNFERDEESKLILVDGVAVPIEQPAEKV